MHYFLDQISQAYAIGVISSELSIVIATSLRILAMTIVSALAII